MVTQGTFGARLELGSSEPEVAPAAIEPTDTTNSASPRGSGSNVWGSSPIQELYRSPRRSTHRCGSRPPPMGEPLAPCSSFRRASRVIPKAR